jgi:hypothetical protein
MQFFKGVRPEFFFHTGRVNSCMNEHRPAGDQPPVANEQPAETQGELF